MAFSFKGLILLLVILIIASVLFSKLFKKSLTGFLEPTKGDYAISTLATPTPKITREIKDVRSPDGKMKLIMKTTKDKDKITYSFSVAETLENAAKKAIFSKTVLSGTTMDMSPNAWSPDNKYFFIFEKNANSVDYFVFRADGEYSSEGEQYRNVVPLFVAENTGYTLSEITGWDSETLLHIYTAKEGESRGPSFWFEVPSKAIIQLASR